MWDNLIKAMKSPLFKKLLKPHLTLIVQYPLEIAKNVSQINEGYTDSFPFYAFNRDPVVGDIFFVNGTTSGEFGRLSFNMTAKVTKIETRENTKFAVFSAIEVVPTIFARTATKASEATHVSNSTTGSESDTYRNVWFSTSIREIARAADKDFQYNPVKKTLKVANIDGKASEAERADFAYKADSATYADFAGIASKATVANTLENTDGTKFGRKLLWEGKMSVPDEGSGASKPSATHEVPVDLKGKFLIFELDNAYRTCPVKITSIATAGDAPKGSYLSIPVYKPFLSDIYECALMNILWSRSGTNASNYKYYLTVGVVGADSDGLTITKIFEEIG